MQELAILGWAVDQLEDERASCYNPRTSRQEVSENEEKVRGDGREAGQLWHFVLSLQKARVSYFA